MNSLYFRLQAVIASAIMLVVLALLMFCMQGSAQAATISHRPHAPIKHLHPAKPAPQKNQHDSFLDLTPEQQGVIQWIFDSAAAKLSPEQAKRIVISAYEKAKAIQIDPIQFLALIRLESRFNPQARSHENAQGLMQVRPAVHKAKFAGRSAYNIEASIDVGSQVLGDCLEKFDHNLFKALNCYSGGGGKGYNQLFERFHHEANHFVVAYLFSNPEAPPMIVDDLPQHDEVYAIATQP